MKISREKIMLQLSLWGFLGLLIPITISSSLTNSGIINAYITYPILAVFFGIALSLWIGKYRLTREPLNVLMMVYILIGCLYVVEIFIRIIHGQPFHKSMQMAVDSYFPVCLFFLIAYGKFNAIKMANILGVSITIFNLYISYHIISENSFRPNIMLNNNVVVLLAISAIFFYVFYINYYKVNKLQILFIFFNICYSMIIIFFSGSRTGLVEGVACIFVTWLISKKKLLFTGAISLGLTISGIIFFTNFGSGQFWMDRAATIDTFSAYNENLSKNANQSFEAINDMLYKAVDERDQQQILIANDMGRILLWKSAISEVKKSPVFGTGEISFSIGSSSPKQTAHNFLLEYTLIYGGTGLLLWITFAIMLLITYYKQFVSFKNSAPPWILMYALFVCAFSCMQPTLSTIQVTLFFWSIMGVFYIVPKTECYKGGVINQLERF